jgi:hypothetical protein
MGNGLAARYGGRQLPSDRESACKILDVFTGSRNATLALLNDTRWPGATLAGPDLSGTPALLVRVAQTGAGVLPGMGGASRIFPSIDGLTVERLANGALRLGTVELTAAILLTQLDQARERDAVLRVIGRFSLNQNEVLDVLAARAYVWADWMAPMVFWQLPWSGPVHDRVAETIMRYERDHPGITGMATRGSRTAQAALETIVNEIVGTVIDDASILERTSPVDPALSASSSRARRLLGAVNLPLWQAHHLIPFAVMASLPVPVQRAIVSSAWLMDSVENLIALPANLAAYLQPPNLQRLPLHNSAHPRYDADVRIALAAVVAGGVSMAVVALRAALLTVETGQRAALYLGRYHPVVR